MRDVLEPVDVKEGPELRCPFLRVEMSHQIVLVLEDEVVNN